MIAELSSDDVRERRARGGELLAARGDAGGGPARRYVVLSSFTVDLMPAFLAEALDRVGVAADVAVGEFGQIVQEALNPHSEVLAAGADAVVLIPAAEDLLRPLFDPARTLSEEDAYALVDDRLHELEHAATSLLERLPGSTCYVVGFGAERAPAEHVLAPGSPARGQLALERFAVGMRRLAERSPGIVVVDWEWHLRGLGRARFADARLWYLARMRLNPLGLATLSDLIAQHVAAHTGVARKVLAVDLDDTLWGGIVGEAGVGGLVLGDEGVGLAFADFQRELLALHRLGVVLVACSKNNPDDAWEVFERHPGMVLRREHFAAERVNWQDKATNLAELAEELSLGLDSFVFLDDNPVEREWVRHALPQVAVPELPKDPVHRPAFLRGLPHFQRIALTEADVQRAASYRAQRDRVELRSRAETLEDYLRSLQQQIDVAPVSDVTLPRAAQLCQRTNQFNLTTRRYTVAELQELLASADAELYTVAVSDRFGDSGITGLAILRGCGDAEIDIDTLLLSCRVLGRGVEETLMEFLIERARSRGGRALIGHYIPTAKNGQAAGLYPRLGFEPAGEGLFRLDLAAEEPIAADRDPELVAQGDG